MKSIYLLVIFILFSTNARNIKKYEDYSKVKQLIF